MEVFLSMNKKKSFNQNHSDPAVWLNKIQVSIGKVQLEQVHIQMVVTIEIKMHRELKILFNSIQSCTTAGYVKLGLNVNLKLTYMRYTKNYLELILSYLMI